MLERLNKSGLARLWRAIQVKLSEKQDILQTGSGIKIEDSLIETVGSRVFYGTCNTGATVTSKVVECPEFKSSDVAAGNIVFINFTNGNTVNSVTFNINNISAGALSSGQGAYRWQSGTSVPFVYNGTGWDLLEDAVATTSYYGKVKLSDSTTSSSYSGVAATPSAVKKAWLKCAYGTCSSLSNSAVKLVQVQGTFDLVNGQILSVEFLYSSETGQHGVTISHININNATGNIPVARNGLLVDIDNQLTWKSGECLTFLYDNSKFEFISKGGCSDTYSLNSGELIPMNSDLDDYCIPGTYYCYDTDISDISNTPYTYNGGFKLLVEEVGAWEDVEDELIHRKIKQTFIPYLNHRIYFRLADKVDEYAATWESWHFLFTSDRGANTKGTNIILDNTNLSPGVTPTSNLAGNARVIFRDDASNNLGHMGVNQATTGVYTVLFGAYNSNSSSSYNELGLRVADDGTKSVYVTDSAIWRTALGLDKWVNTSTYVTTITSVITAGTNITINAAQYVQFGKVAQIYISWKSSAAISVPANGNITDVTVGTIVSGKRPKVLTFGMSNGANPAAGGAYYSISTSGSIVLTSLEATGTARTVAANTNCYVMATYILA